VPGALHCLIQKSQAGNIENYANGKSKGAIMHTKPMQATLGRAISDEITASQRFGQAPVAAETTWGVQIISWRARAGDTEALNRRVVL